MPDHSKPVRVAGGGKRKESLTHCVISSVPVHVLGRSLSASLALTILAAPCHPLYLYLVPNLMSRAPAPPPLPAAPRPRKPADVPSHAEFLLDQVRASLAQLHQGQALDAVTYRDLESRLSRAVLRQPPLPTDIGAGTGSSEADSEEVQLGKRNAWVRKAMTETDVLPNIVETALSTVAGPFLSGTAVSSLLSSEPLAS